MQGDCLELKAEIEPQGATEFGLKVRRSPDGEEETVIVYSPITEQLKIDLTKSTLDDEVQYPRLTPQDEDGGERYTNSQTAPFTLAERSH